MKKYNKRRTRINLIQIIYATLYSPDINYNNFKKLLNPVIGDLNNVDDVLDSFSHIYFNNTELVKNILKIVSEKDDYNFELLPKINQSIILASITELLSLTSSIPLIINEYIEISNIYSGLDDYKMNHIIMSKCIELILQNNQKINKFYVDLNSGNG